MFLMFLISPGRCPASAREVAMLSGRPPGSLAAWLAGWLQKFYLASQELNRWGSGKSLFCCPEEGPLRLGSYTSRDPENTFSQYLAACYGRALGGIVHFSRTPGLGPKNVPPPVDAAKNVHTH